MILNLIIYNNKLQLYSS